MNEEQNAEKILATRGVFCGFGGLRGLANASEFWERQEYGTRLYYGRGVGEYLHRGVLRTALKTMDSLAPVEPSLRSRLRAAWAVLTGKVQVLMTPNAELTGAPSGASGAAPLLGQNER